MTFNIFGSCVSRDMVEFIASRKVERYIARQTIASATFSAPGEELIAKLVIKDGTHPFHVRCIMNDIKKTSLEIVRQSDATDAIWLIDMIEERFRMGVLSDGSIVTFSHAARDFSNLKELITSWIAPFSDEHLAAFKARIEQFASAFTGQTVVIHRAYYAYDKREVQSAENLFLSKLYSMLLDVFPTAIALEADPAMVLPSQTHKWGLAPYHYSDCYYKHVVAKLGLHFPSQITLSQGVTLQKQSS